MWSWRYSTTFSSLWISTHVSLEVCGSHTTKLRRGETSLPHNQAYSTSLSCNHTCVITADRGCVCSVALRLVTDTTHYHTRPGRRDRLPIPVFCGSLLYGAGDIGRPLRPLRRFAGFRSPHSLCVCRRLSGFSKLNARTNEELNQNFEVILKHIGAGDIGTVY